MPMSIPFIGTQWSETASKKETPKKPMDWTRIEVKEGASFMPEPCEIEGVKKYLRKHGVEVKKYLWDIGEYAKIEVRKKDMGKVAKLISKKKLREFC